jgi:hypothetical protein
MRTIGPTVIMLLASISFGAAQDTSKQTTDNSSGSSQLSTTQRSEILHGLRNEPQQSSLEASQAQPGGKMPSSVTARSMPDNVSDQVPEAKTYLFVKLPDRVLLIDPSTQMVAQVLLDTESGDTDSDGSSNRSNSHQ